MIGGFIMNITTIIVSLITGLTSSSFLAFLGARLTKHDKFSQMLLGLGHHEILEDGQKLIDKGFVTIQELDDFNHYLFEPYKALGGNGTGEEVAKKVNSLPIKGGD